MVSGTAYAITKTVTFTGLPPELFPGETFIENGVTVSGGPVDSVGSFTIPNTAHLTDTGSGFASILSFTTGGLFDFKSIDILTLGTEFFVDGVNAGYDNVQITGLLNGKETGSQLFSTGTLDMVTLQITDSNVGQGFMGIDELLVSSLFPADLLNPSGGPTFGGMTIGGKFLECLDAPCGDFSIDNLVLATSTAVVPLPASILLLLTGIAGLGIIGRRRRMIA